MTLVFRTARDPQSIRREETAQAEAQGIDIRLQSAITGMNGEGPRLTHIEITPLHAKGQAVGAGERIPVDLLLTATGRFPELIYVPQEAAEAEEPLRDPVPWQTLFPYAGPYAEEDNGIFRPGEVTTDYKAVVEAIGSGRRAASSIHHYFSDEPVAPPAHMIRTHTRVLSLDQVKPVSLSHRHRMPEIPREARIREPSAEIALGYSEKDAREEAGRCLQCGLICYRRQDVPLH